MTNRELSDRTLLKLAAKAAGLDIEGDADKLVVFPDRFAGGFSVFNEKGGSQLWNPLEDDGDALRLAVKLNIWPTRGGWGEYQYVVTVQEGADYWVSLATEEVGDNPYAATRRAIVRAAAELGKQMA